MYTKNNNKNNTNKKKHTHTPIHNKENKTQKANEKQNEYLNKVAFTIFKMGGEYFYYCGMGQ